MTRRARASSCCLSAGLAEGVVAVEPENQISFSEDFGAHASLGAGASCVCPDRTGNGTAAGFALSQEYCRSASARQHVRWGSRPRGTHAAPNETFTAPTRLSAAIVRSASSPAELGAPATDSRPAARRSSAAPIGRIGCRASGVPGQWCPAHPGPRARMRDQADPLRHPPHPRCRPSGTFSAATPPLPAASRRARWHSGRPPRRRAAGRPLPGATSGRRPAAGAGHR